MIRDGLPVENLEPRLVVRLTFPLEFVTLRDGDIRFAEIENAVGAIASTEDHLEVGSDFRRCVFVQGAGADNEFVGGHCHECGARDVGPDDVCSVTLEIATLIPSSFNGSGRGLEVRNMPAPG